MRSKRLLLFGKKGKELDDYATANAFSGFRDPINAEQLLKAADDLDNASYWIYDNVTASDQGSGVWRLTKTAAAAWKDMSQGMVNWFPAWAGRVSFFLEVRAGTLDNVRIGMRSDSVDVVDEIEIISGSGSDSISGGMGVVTGLDAGWTSIRCSASVKGWTTNVHAIIFPDGGNTNTGYLEVRNVQFVTGDQAKPRPTQTDPDDWMLANRPHNRVFADGNGRFSATDSEGKLFCGDWSDGKLEPSDAETFNCPADFFFEQAVTVEDGQYWYMRLRYTDTSNYFQIGITSARDVLLRNRVAGSNEDLYSGTTTLADATRYRIRLEASGSNYRLYVDDELLDSGTVTNAGNNSVEGGIVEENYVGTAEYLITSTYGSTSTDVMFAGPVAVAAYGDPGLWITDVDGSAFSVGASDAVLFKAKNFVSGKAALFGLDSGTSGALAQPWQELSTIDVLRVSTAGGNETNQTWTAGTEKTFMQLLRSDTNGSQFLLHESGKTWKRFNVNDDAIPAASAYPAISNYNALLVVSNFALLDLSAYHDAEWCAVTDSETNPASLTYYSVNADCQINATLTFETGKFANIYFRNKADDSEYMQLLFNTDGNVLLRKRVGGSTSNVGTTGVGTLSDGVAYEIDVVADGTSIKVFIDKALQIDGTVTDAVLLSNAKGLVEHDYATNDIVLTTHPYPALGGSGGLGATDRQVCPQASDTGTADADCLAILRATQVPSAGNLQVELRKSGSDEITYDVDSAGKPILYDNATARVTGNNGDVSSDDDNLIVLDGADGEIFTNGATDGSTSAIAHTSGTTWNIASLGTAGAADALVLWPLTANMPFKI